MMKNGDGLDSLSGQVPKTKFGIVGSGRAAKHMAHYLNLLGFTPQRWSRSLHDSITPYQQFSECAVILILIKDDAIESFINQWPELQLKTLVHFSGSLVTPLAHGIHPLMTFGDELYDLATYEKIPLVGESNIAHEVFKSFKNPIYNLDPSLKPLYHALCVLSGNFTMLIWKEFFEILENKMSLPRNILYPYLEKTFENLKNLSPEKITGPLSRGDVKTIAKNIESLKDTRLQTLYEVFVATFANHLFSPHKDEKGASHEHLRL